MIIITGGGTGGHIYPGIALAHALREQGQDVHWLGAAGGLEETLVPQAKIPLTTLPAVALRQGGLLAKFKALYALFRGVLRTCGIYRRYKPKLVIAMGGYASTAGGIAAKLCRVPLVLHEQNAAPGMSNRMLARFANKIFCAFPRVLPSKKTLYVGNPARAAFTELPPPAERYQNRDKPIRLLILGGSQGAKVLNGLVPEALVQLKKTETFTVRHLSGKLEESQVRARYHAANINAEVAAYHDNIVEDFAWCDLLIARAGAMTVTEVMHAGVAAVFIPFPYAVDDHQTKNARLLVENQAALSLAQKSLTAEALASHLQKLLQSRDTLQQMAEKSYQLRQVDTVGKILEAVKEFL